MLVLDYEIGEIALRADRTTAQGTLRIKIATTDTDPTADDVAVTVRVASHSGASLADLETAIHRRAADLFGQLSALLGTCTPESLYQRTPKIAPLPDDPA